MKVSTDNMQRIKSGMLFLLEFYKVLYLIRFVFISLTTKPNNNLDEEIEKYPIIKNNMNNLNRIYYKLTLISIYAVFLNFVLSCIYIIPNNYGANTFTSLLSFGMLVLMKLFVYLLYFVLAEFYCLNL